MAMQSQVSDTWSVGPWDCILDSGVPTCGRDVIDPIKAAAEIIAAAYEGSVTGAVIPIHWIGAALGSERPCRAVARLTAHSAADGSSVKSVPSRRVEAGTNAPAVLDHPVLGRLLLFDPTDPHVPAGHLPDDEQGSWALIGAESGYLVRVPAGPAVAAERTRLVEAALSTEMA